MHRKTPRLHYFFLGWADGTTWRPVIEVWRCGWEDTPYPRWLRWGESLRLMQLRECHFCGKCSTIARLKAAHGEDYIPMELRD